MTVELLFEQYMDERQALGFVGKTDRDCIRRFLRDYEELENGKVDVYKRQAKPRIGVILLRTKPKIITEERFIQSGHS